ncbi:uncharacterized protein KY384_001244 [Bacidia gigantensis]|uniref:uncharacterized protein n=1 Tax=Bacidia gigantensis TaxID=2732470 RepID=UPI001D055EB3|nr:uncharacterized protein KY384_001244 [Bacidia gigantensis]KAG8534399.1 hypothetical protein KY384_001244 [Bacidia gigantensis]
MATLNDIALEVYVNISQYFTTECIQSISATSKRLRALSKSEFARHVELKRRYDHVKCDETNIAKDHGQLLLDITREPRLASYIHHLEIDGDHQDYTVNVNDKDLRNPNLQEEENVLTWYEAHRRCPRPFEYFQSIDYECSLSRLLKKIPDIKCLTVNLPGGEFASAWQPCGFAASHHPARPTPGCQPFQHLEQMHVVSEDRDVGIGLFDVFPFAFLPSMKRFLVYGLKSGYFAPSSNHWSPNSLSGLTQLSLHDCEIDPIVLERSLSTLPNLEHMYFIELRSNNSFHGRQSVDVEKLCHILTHLYGHGAFKSFKKLRLESSREGAFIQDLRGLNGLQCLEVNHPALICFELGRRTELPQSIEQLHVHYSHVWEQESSVFRDLLLDIMLLKSDVLPKFNRLDVTARLNPKDGKAIEQTRSYPEIARRASEIGLTFKVTLERYADGTPIVGDELAELLPSTANTHLQ